MIVQPQKYLSSEIKDIQVVSKNIMKEHIAFEKLTEKRREDRKATYIPTFDVTKMEAEMLNFKPRYQLPTTSRIIKELPLDDEEILEFKEHQKTIERCKTSQGKLRTDLNPRVDIVEFLLNNRAKRLERFIEKSNLELLKTPGQVTDTIQTENNDIFANRKLSEMDSHKIEYGYKHPQLFTQRGIRTSKSSRSHSKITPYTNPFNASKVKRIIDDVEKANKQKIFENYFTGKVRKTKRQPFEHQGMN